jgi:hypothetical protein
MAGFNNDIVFAQEGMRIGDTTISTSEVASIQFDESAGDVALLLHNSSATAASTSHLKIQAQSDSYLDFSQANTKTWVFGIDQSDANNLKINVGNSGISPSSGTPVFQVDTGPFSAEFYTNSLAAIKSNVGSLCQVQALQQDPVNSASCARFVARTESTTADAMLLLDVENVGSPGSTSWLIGSNGANTGSLDFNNFVNAGVSNLNGTTRMRITQGGIVFLPNVSGNSVSNSVSVVMDSTTGELGTAAGGGGGAWEFVSTTVASASASVDFTDLTASKVYMVVMDSVKVTTDAVALHLLVSTNNGISFAAVDYQYDSLQGGAVGTAAEISLTGSELIGNATGEFGFSGTLIMYNANVAAQPAFFSWESTLQTSSLGELLSASGGGVSADDNNGGSTVEIDAIRFICSSGTIASGNFHLYSLVTS